jgi:hypothetical protein
MLLTGSFGIANMVVPAGGPKVVPTLVDFSNAASVTLDGQQIVSQGKIEYLQGVFIDNSANVNNLSLLMSTTNQLIICPKKSQGYFSIMVPDPPQIIASTTQLIFKFQCSFIIFQFNPPCGALHNERYGNDAFAANRS